MNKTILILFGAAILIVFYLGLQYGKESQSSDDKAQIKAMQEDVYTWQMMADSLKKSAQAHIQAADVEKQVQAKGEVSLKTEAIRYEHERKTVDTAGAAESWRIISWSNAR